MPSSWVGDLVDYDGSFVYGVYVPMSTAIVRTYVEDGFVIAADGLARNSETGAVVSDENQKIFPIGGSGSPSLAYSITGSTFFLSPPTAPGVVFDLAEEMKIATQALSSKRSSSLLDYATRVCGSVHRRLQQVKLEGLDYPESSSFDANETGATIARVLFDGYHQETPFRVKARFFHNDQALAPPEVLQQNLAPGAPWCQGPVRLTNMMWGDEPNAAFLKQYEMNAIRLVGHPNEILRIHAQMAHAYISACSDPEAIAFDPPQCAGIGGHIHIATITPKDGFKWIVGCEPA